MKIILYVFAAISLLASVDAYAASANCGKEGGRPCTVFERIPSCNTYLVEDFSANKCVHPKSCGRLDQRPCTVVERIPSCDQGVVEDALQGKCVKPSEVLTAAEIARRAAVEYCKATVAALKTGGGILASAVSALKSRQAGDAGFLRNSKVLSDAKAAAGAYADKIPEIKRIATIMNDPKNRQAINSIFNPDSFCGDSDAARAKKLNALRLIPSYFQLRVANTYDDGVSPRNVSLKDGQGTLMIAWNYAFAGGFGPLGANVVFSLVSDGVHMYAFLTFGNRIITNFSGSFIAEIMILPKSTYEEVAGFNYYLGAGAGEGPAAGLDFGWDEKLNFGGVGGGVGFAGGALPAEAYGGINYTIPLYPTN
jgi:hypothetical protein